jgi:F-type H+-transporting ATPase subunit delta
MIGSAVGKRYATALYELAEQDNAVESVGASLKALADAWHTSEELRAVIENPRFGPESKRSVAGALAERVKAPVLLKNALFMLTDRRRLVHLPEIADAFARIAEKRSNVVRAEVVTASRLPEAYFDQLRKTLEQATGKKVALVRREDPSLIGGVVTTVEGRVFDGSVKNRLRELRAQLLNASSPTGGQS